MKNLPGYTVTKNDKKEGPSVPRSYQKQDWGHQGSKLTRSKIWEVSQITRIGVCRLYNI